MPDIRSKVAIVTGAGRGIGRGIALGYARAGAWVVVASRSRTTVDRVVAEIEGEGGKALGITCDVGERDQVFAMIERTVRVWLVGHSRQQPKALPRRERPPHPGVSRSRPTMRRIGS